MIDKIKKKSDADLKALFDYMKEKIKESEDNNDFDPDDDYFEPWLQVYAQIDNEFERRLGFKNKTIYVKPFDREKQE